MVQALADVVHHVLSTNCGYNLLFFDFVSDNRICVPALLCRFRNFEQLHRRLKDMPYYNLTLPPKRFLSSNLDTEFIRDRCILLNKFLKVRS